MILLGFDGERFELGGNWAKCDELFWTECVDYHDAAKKLWVHNRPSSSRIGMKMWKAEFHDCGTSRTWSVDSAGHTQKDYRTEKTEDFVKRYGGSSRVREL